MGNEPQTLTEMPLWVLILLAALGGVSGEMWRADKAGLGGWALLRRLALRSGASIVCGVAVMLLALACGAALLFAAALGSLTAAAIQGPMLQKIIGVFALAMAVQMGFDLRPKATGRVPGRPELSLVGVVIGWASAIFGIGGGSLSVPYLTWRSVPMQQAVATSSACGLPIAISGALSFIAVGWHNPQLPEWSLGYVYLPALVGIAATSMLFARFGARLAHRLSPRVLKRLFALLLFSVGISFLTPDLAFLS